MNYALNYWAALQPYRSERQRCKNYTYGRQWKDMITADDGRRITEEQYIREQGSAPLKNNLIRRIVRNVLGVFRNNYGIPDFDDVVPPDMVPDSPDYLSLKRKWMRAVDSNSLEELYTRVLEEYLIGGMAVVRKRFSTEEGGAIFTDIVKSDGFFFNSDASDPLGRDLHTIGEIHTLSGESDPLFKTPALLTDSFGRTLGRRVYEIWQRKPEEGTWTFRFLSEDGAILHQGDSPFPGGDHPYTMKAYPFIDGEIHSFVADCIDQQRYINRLITLNDWIIRASAKGVLLFPEGAIPDDLDLEEIAAQWSRYNGVIRYRARTGTPEPRQISTNSTNIGISELLGIQLKMMEDVSGINSALQGQLSSGAVSGTLYEQQTRHALTGIADIIEGFRVFMLSAERKSCLFLKELSY